LWLPMHTIFYCFIRNGREMPNLKIKDIDFENAKIWVNEEFSKNGSTEAVTIPRQLMEEFTRMNIHTYPKNYYVFGKHGEPAEKPVARSFFQKRFKEILIGLGIYTKRKGFYRIKNSGNVALVKANINRTAMQKQNRHASFETTEYYIASLNVTHFPELRDNFPTL
jgi:integrase